MLNKEIPSGKNIADHWPNENNLPRSMPGISTWTNPKIRYSVVSTPSLAKKHPPNLLRCKVVPNQFQESKRPISRHLPFCTRSHAIVAYCFAFLELRSDRHRFWNPNYGRYFGWPKPCPNLFGGSGESYGSPRRQLDRTMATHSSLHGGSRERLHGESIRRLARSIRRLFCHGIGSDASQAWPRTRPRSPPSHR